MTRTEKRYFKINAASISGRDNSVYLRLFDAIEAQQVYNEKLLKEKFKGEKFVKQFSVAKNYLQHIIIKSLTAYHASLSINMEITDLLRSLEVMYEKGHYTICQKIIRKGKELAEKYEKFVYLDRFLEWESRIHFTNSNFYATRKTLYRQRDNLATIQADLESKTLALEMYEKTTEFGFVATSQQMRELEQILKAAKEKRISEATGIMGKYYHYSLWHMYYCCTDNYAKRFEYSEKILGLLESYPHFIEENPSIYTAALNNYANSLLAFGDTKKAIKMAKKMRELPELYNISKWEREKNSALLLSYDIEIVAYISKAEISRALTLEEEIEQLLNLHESQIQKNNLFEVCYNMAIVHFLAGHFEKCLRWIYYIINARDLSHREDLYIAARLFTLLIHYELNNELLLKNLVISMQRFLRARKRLFAPEMAFFHFLKLCGNHTDHARQIYDLNKLLQEINRHPEESIERKMINMIYLVPWIQSKLQQKSMAEIISVEYLRATRLNKQK